MAIEKFNIAVSPFVLDDLRERLGRARWPDAVRGANWDYGTDPEYLRELCDHWGHGYDWQEHQDNLNTFDHYRASIDGFGLHFIHHRGKGRHSVPILLIHGYPDSFVRFLKIIPLLTAADAQDRSFDVVVPSIPGFGFSDRPGEKGMDTTRIAELFVRLMTKELGYKKFIAHGGDWGSSITEQIALHHPESLLGIHLTDIPYRHLFTMRAETMTEAEKKYLAAGQQWLNTEGAYALLQSSKPQTLAYAVNDSPMGLAAWILEKFHSWTDTNDSPEGTISRDELLTNLTIYWVTQTVGSSFRIYYETMHARGNGKTEGNGKPDDRIGTPTAVAMFPRDMVPAPREYAERIFNLQQWTPMPRGGHFAAMEQPQLLAEDIRGFAVKLQ